jgi:predicted nucleic acid-binding protein
MANDDSTIDIYPSAYILVKLYSALKRFAVRKNLTAYDAVYVALAEALGASLVTCDANIAAAPGHHAQIDVI